MRRVNWGWILAWAFSIGVWIAVCALLCLSARAVLADDSGPSCCGHERGCWELLRQGDWCAEGLEPRCAGPGACVCVNPECPEEQDCECEEPTPTDTPTSTVTATSTSTATPTDTATATPTEDPLTPVPTKVVRRTPTPTPEPEPFVPELPSLALLLPGLGAAGVYAWKRVSRE